MSNIARKLEIFVIVIVIALAGIIYAFKQRPVLAPTIENNHQIAVGEPNPSAPVEYQGEDGKTALELLQKNFRVEVKHYSFGDMVTSINGIMPDSSHFWAMYVNGNFSQVGASQYITKSKDRIKWQIDKVN